MNITKTSKIFLGDTEIYRVEYQGTVIWKKQVVPPTPTGGTIAYNANGNVIASTTSSIIPPNWLADDKNVASVVFDENVTEIKQYAFNACPNLTSVTFNSNLQIIGMGAFNSCNLSTVDIPDSVTTLSDWCFDGNNNLTQVNGCNNVEFMGDHAFYDCALTSFTIPTKVTSLNKYALGSNPFTSITIPAQVTSIGDMCFASCTGLTEIICESETEITNFGLTAPFNNIPSTGTLKTPNSSSVWSTFLSKLPSGWKQEKQSSTWKLDENGYILGEDGKYYQRYYDDSQFIDNNPIPMLNDQWVEDTVSGALNIDKNYDYFMSNSNYHVSGSYSQFSVTWSGLTSVTFLYRSYAESSWDYLIINGLDKPKFTSQPSSSTAGILAHTKGKQTTTYNTLTVPCTEDTHTIWFCYIKDSSGDSNSDRAFVGVPNNYKSGEIFEKKGNELRYEYIQSTDYVLSEIEGYIRYKSYKTYFSPNNVNQFTTSDYVLTEEVPATPITKNYLRFDATTNDVTIGFNNLSLVTDLQYSTNYEELFTDFPSTGVTIHQGKSMWVRAKGMSTSSSTRSFTTSAPVECHGDVRSMLAYSNFENTALFSYCFYGLFSKTSITTVPELKAAVIKDRCYCNMFDSCKLLTTIPEGLLPSTTLQIGCYQNMFSGCTSLTTIPERLLPSTTLQTSCYGSMFAGCTSLTTIPESLLPATKGGGYSYSSMFAGCTSLTTIPNGLLQATSLGGGSYSSMFSGCTSLTTIPERLLPSTTLAYGCYKNMFAGCTSLTTIPESLLPATTVAAYSYQSMFSGCTSLTTVPSTLLPATTFMVDGFNEYSNAYSSMFAGCTSLTQAPELPSTNLAYGCYNSMFAGCTSLTTIPESLLPATTVAAYSYQSMFSGCTSLTTVPSTLLPATTFMVDSYKNSNAYSSMFAGCTSLTQAPELPATTLANSCYNSMFAGCTSLTQAPELPATTLANSCYNRMFSGCKSLNYVKVRATSWNTTNADVWLYNVATTGTFIKPRDTEIPSGTNGIPNGWTVENILPNYLRFDAVDNEVTIGLNDYSFITEPQYSFDRLSWDTFSTEVTVPQGSTMYVRAKGKPSSYSRLTFTTSAAVECHGDVRSMLAYSNFENTALSSYCFYGLFSDSSITTAPELLSTTLAENCYTQMFSGCENLIQAPELPATNLANGCYNQMFSGCKSLNYVKVRATSWNTTNAGSWLYNVATTGTFIKPSGTSIPINDTSGVPRGWTVENY